MKFDKIANKWSKALEIYFDKGVHEYREYTREHGLNIALTDKCFMGEAYGFTNDYDKDAYTKDNPKKICSDCTKLGMDAYRSFELSASSLSYHIPTAETMKIVKKIEKHWCGVHTKKKKK